jgi:hypothetical protein
MFFLYNSNGKKNCFHLYINMTNKYFKYIRHYNLDGDGMKNDDNIYKDFVTGAKR